MSDTIKASIDTTMTLIKDSIISNDSIAVNSFSNQTNFPGILENKIFVLIILPLLLLIIGWFLKNIYDKYFSIRPKLFLGMSRPLYGQSLRNFYEGYDLSWRFECSLKNNSKHDAYNVKILEIKTENESEKIITNHEALKRSFTENNHLSSNASKDFEIKKTIHVDTDVLANVIIENEQKIILPGLKIQNPEIQLMPKVLNNIKLVIMYENEKGKKFYTKFTKNSKSTNKIMSHKPFTFKKLI